MIPTVGRHSVRLKTHRDHSVVTDYRRNRTTNTARTPIVPSLIEWNSSKLPRPTGRDVPHNEGFRHTSSDDVARFCRDELFCSLRRTLAGRYPARIVPVSPDLIPDELKRECFAGGDSALEGYQHRFRVQDRSSDDGGETCTALGKDDSDVLVGTRGSYVLRRVDNKWTTVGASRRVYPRSR